MTQGLVIVAYIVASILFILSLGGLSRQDTAQRGNQYGIAGICIALLATVLGVWQLDITAMLVAMAVGGMIGAVLAARVAMTEMPQLVAILHSFVGLAAVLVGFAGYYEPLSPKVGAEHTIHLIEIFIGVFIGAVTFTGSIVAFGKLDGRINGKALLLPHRHGLNLAVVVLSVLLGVGFTLTTSPWLGGVLLFAMTVLALLLGLHLVLAIGGADMPVVVSMLNSYSGWAAAATGFMLSNDLLIVTGALVGSSGAILSYIMCRAMNRSFISVIMGGFGQGVTQSASEFEDKPVQQTHVPQLVNELQQAQRVVIVPGYGMAVAQAQHPVSQICQKLQQRNIEVRFAIHPVAGRLPGHMNVLLAEANVPYDIVLEMDEINEQFAATDLVLIIGANDIVNPGALDDPHSPIAGMPVLEVWKARKVVVLKRSMATGYAGVQNPLFFKDNTEMLFGDAKALVEQIQAQMHTV